MFHFNAQEKVLVLGFCFCLIFGAGLNFALKKYPFLYDTLHLMESTSIYPKVNVNTASREELERIPYIGAYTAKQIILYRQKNGDFTSLNDLPLVRGIKQKNFERFQAYLKVK